MTERRRPHPARATGAHFPPAFIENADDHKATEEQALRTDAERYRKWRAAHASKSAEPLLVVLGSAWDAAAVDAAIDGCAVVGAEAKGHKNARMTTKTVTLPDDHWAALEKEAFLALMTVDKLLAHAVRLLQHDAAQARLCLRREYVNDKGEIQN